MQQPQHKSKPAATANGNPNTSHFFPSFHPPLWFVTPGAPLAMGQQQSQSTAAAMAATAAAKPKAPYPPQSAPKSYAGMVEEEEEEEGWSEDEDWSDSEWEEDWSSDEVSCWCMWDCGSEGASSALG